LPTTHGPSLPGSSPCLCLQAKFAEVIKNVGALNQKCIDVQKELAQEKERRAMAETALVQQQKEAQEARKAATAAAAAAGCSDAWPSGGGSVSPSV
jgi:hypothetical protein